MHNAELPPSNKYRTIQTSELFHFQANQTISEVHVISITEKNT